MVGGGLGDWLVRRWGGCRADRLAAAFVEPIVEPIGELLRDVEPIARPRDVTLARVSTPTTNACVFLYI